jgi:hypothetical protein
MGIISKPRPVPRAPEAFPNAELRQFVPDPR